MKTVRIAAGKRSHWVEVDEIEYQTLTAGKAISERLTHWGQKIIVDIDARETPLTLDMAQAGETVPAYDRSDRWTTWPKAELCKAGYQKAEGLYDSVLWWGVPVYCRFTGVEEYDIKETDEDGRLIWSQESPSRLNDIIEGALMSKAVKGFGKIEVGKMDLQKLLMFGMIAAGAVLGMWMLGVF